MTVLKAMVERKRGRIINVSSSATLFPIPYGSAYGISKAALLRLTEFFAAEAKAYGISAFAIDPGAVRTAMLDFLVESEPTRKWLPHIRRYVLGGGPLNTLEQATGLVTLLASGQADSLSGRFFQVTDNLDQLIAGAEQIQKDDLYTLRLRALRVEETARV